MAKRRLRGAMTSLRLKTLIAAAISILSLILTAGVSHFIGRDAVNRLEKEIGRSLTLLAIEAQDKLDRAMFAKLQAIRTLAALGPLSIEAGNAESRDTVLARFQNANPDFSWLEYAARDGTLVSNTNGRMDGSKVVDQSWFENGLNAEYVGQAKVQDLAAHDSEPEGQRGAGIIDIAVPVSIDGGPVTGVLGASLGAEWANEIKDTLVGGVKSGHQLDVIVLNENRQVLLGPSDLAGHVLDLPSLRAAQTGLSDYATEIWPDGTYYLTGFSKSDGYRSFPGLRWIVLVREGRTPAFASVESLQRDILSWGLVFAAAAALVAWILADRLSGPLLQLTVAAENLRLGRQSEIAEIGGYREVRVLSRSLRTLVNELTKQKTALAQVNQSLEGQVRERTRQLEVQNINLERAKTEAELATDAKSRFLAAASHDLRQPLHALTLFARALSRRVSGGEAAMLVANMDEALAALKGMFDALLNVSRLDAKMIEPECVPVSVGEIIDRVAVGFRAEAAQSGLKFLSHRANWTLQTDPALLETILRNLISNALKFTSSGGVLLAARRRGGQSVIDVYDTGPGLPAELHEKIFQEFARTEDRASGVNDGLGLGLSIARRYCDLLGLKIQLCSRIGRGSRFTLILPERIFTNAARVSNLHPVNVAPLAGLKILILDDAPLIVSALSRDLKDRGNATFGYQSIADAERAIAGGLSFDAAIVDFDLRGSETGLEFINRISEQLGTIIPTLLLSGGTDSDTLSAMARSGRPWLTKPADPDFIVATLSSICKPG